MKDAQGHERGEERIEEIRLDSYSLLANGKMWNACKCLRIENLKQDVNLCCD